jgi:serine protease
LNNQIGRPLELQQKRQLASRKEHMKKLSQIGCLALLGIGLVACPGPTNNRATISGKINLANTKPQSVPDFVAGQVIVKFRPAAQVANAVQLRASGLKLARVRSLGIERTALYSTAANHDQTLKMVADLSSRADVEYAQVVRMYKALAAPVPNDTNYALQWHYTNMNLPAAWEITTGSSSTVVAVVDDGMLYNAASPDAATNDADPLTHPDFAGKVIGGYDFISSDTAAEDGDGRDANPYDNRRGLHGTHVAGTIAAATNNAAFGAGVNWNAKLLNIRVLGKGGGSEADITDGVLWAAGLPVNGLTNNPNPAKVINMSLGGDGPCTPFEQDVYNKATNAGAIIVVAAGNENENVNKPKSPANCQSVITVGAVGPTNLRAPYSNFGPRVDVMAPGGDGSLSITVNEKRYQGSVFSTYMNAGKTTFNLGAIDGTSMATPHVSGVVSLMAALKPSITFAEARDFLKNSATAMAANACSAGNSAVDDSTGCGAGLVDAAKALQALQASLGVTVTVPVPPTPPATNPIKDFVVAENQNNPSESKQVEVNLNPTSSNLQRAVSPNSVSYKITDLAPGQYIIRAYADLDGDSKFDPDEPSGSSDEDLTSGENKEDEDLEMSPDSP